MAFLAPVMAGAGGWTLKKILPWAISATAIIGLGAALRIETARLSALRVELAATVLQRDLQAADAKRWVQTAGEMRKVIDDQAAQLTRHSVDLAKAQELADATAEAQAAEIATLTNERDQLQVRAHAHPDQVRPLGPLVRDLLAGMREPGKSTTPVPATDH